MECKIVFMKKSLGNIEAIECLKQIKHILLNNNSWLESTHNPITQSFDMAMKALEEKENKMKKYEERKELTYKYLDKIPWDKVLNTYDYIEDIFEDISTKYSDGLNLPKEFYGDIFNFIDIEDFIDYLEERNICNISEETKIIPYISKINYDYIKDLKKQYDDVRTNN